MPGLTHGDAQDLVERLKRAWEKRDVDAVMDCFAADAELRRTHSRPLAAPTAMGCAAPRLRRPR
jgi:ketosteroid isomerase-like protein